MVFCVWLFPLSIMFSRVLACISTSLLLLLIIMPLCGYTTFYLSIPQLMGIWVVSMFLAIMNNGAMNICVYIFVWLFVFTFIWYIHRFSFIFESFLAGYKIWVDKLSSFSAFKILLHRPLVCIISGKKSAVILFFF